VIGTTTWPLQGGLDPDVCELLLARTSRRVYHPGDLLGVDGVGPDRMFFVSSGCVAVRTTTRAGDAVTLAVLGPGSSFGEESLVDDHRPVSDGRRPFHVVALDRVEARVLRREDYLDLCLRAPAVERFLVQLLAARVRRLSEQVVDALHLSAEERVVRRLVELVAMYDEPARASGARGAPVVRPAEPVVVPLRQEDLASLAGLARPTTNRVLRQLAAQGLVTMRRGRTVVLDPAGLRRLTDA
jgi:CRP-like cAMP-binding protein